MAATTFLVVVVATPPALWLFARRQWGGGLFSNLWRLVSTGFWPLGLLLFILIEKEWIDRLNDPVKAVVGDRTGILHAVEGDWVLHLQRALEAEWLTAALSAHYLVGYVFLAYFTVILWLYVDDRELARLSAFGYSLVYLLSIPFYLLFNVQVTSDAIPGMKALLYQSDAAYYSFFLARDPLDNAFPSLHIAIPFAMLVLAGRAMRRRGYTLRTWEHRGFLLFAAANVAVFMVSILYLGIHWVLDIPGGLLVGFLAAGLAEEFAPGFFAACGRIETAAVVATRRVTAVLRRRPDAGSGPVATLPDDAP